MFPTFQDRVDELGYRHLVGEILRLVVHGFWVKVCRLGLCCAGVVVVGVVTDVGCGVGSGRAPWSREERGLPGSSRLLRAQLLMCVSSGSSGYTV